MTKALREFAEGCATFAADLLHWALTWWVQTPTPNPDQPAVRIGQHYLWPLIGFVLAASILAAGIRVALSRKGAPLLDLGLGMVKYALTATVGLMALGAAVTATDAFSQWMLDTSAPRLEATMKAALSPENMSEGPPGPGVYIGLLSLASNLMFLSAIQWILGFLRQAGIIIYAALLPLAAAGSLSQLGKQWLPRVVSTLITLVFYKPAAAFILVLGELFLQYGGQQNNVTTLLTGMMILIASAIAMPAMYKFFQPFGIQLGSGGGTLAAAGGMLANLPSKGGSGGSGSGSSGPPPAVQQANYMQANGPHGGGQSSTPPSGAGPSGPRTPAGSSGGSAASTGGKAAGTAGGGATTASPAAATGTGAAAGGSAGAAGGGAAAAASGPAAPAVATGVAATQAAKKAGEQTANTMSSNDPSDPPQGANT